MHIPFTFAKERSFIPLYREKTEAQRDVLTCPEQQRTFAAKMHSALNTSILLHRPVALLLGTIRKGDEMPLVYWGRIFIFNSYVL